MIWPDRFKIKEHVEKKFPWFNVVYVENKDYASTNCIYSLWLAREYLDDDIIYMTGDIIMDASVLQEILKAKDENIIYVNKELELPEKDFKAKIQDGVVKKISEDVFGPDASFCLPLIKLSKKVVSNWLEKADELIKEKAYQQALVELNNVEVSKSDSALFQYKNNLLLAIGALQSKPDLIQRVDTSELSVYPYNYKLMHQAFLAKANTSLYFCVESGAGIICRVSALLEYLAV